MSYWSLLFILYKFSFFLKYRIILPFGISRMFAPHIRVHVHGWLYLYENVRIFLVVSLGLCHDKLEFVIVKSVGIFCPLLHVHIWGIQNWFQYQIFYLRCHHWTFSNKEIAKIFVTFKTHFLFFSLWVLCLYSY